MFKKKKHTQRKRRRSECLELIQLFLYFLPAALYTSCNCSSSICPGHNGLRQKRPEPAGKHKQGWTCSSQLTSCSSGVLGGLTRASYFTATSLKLPAHKNQNTAWQQRKSREERMEKGSKSKYRHNHKIKNTRSTNQIFISSHNRPCAQPEPWFTWLFSCLETQLSTSHS